MPFRQQRHRPTCVLHPALQAGIDADLASWRRGSIPRHALRSGLQVLPRGESDVHVSIGVYNNSIYWLNPLSRPRSAHVYALVDDLLALVRRHAVPDVEFLFNADDYSKAQRRRVPTSSASSSRDRRTRSSTRATAASHVPLPLFSCGKREHAREQGRSASRTIDYDVLVPSGTFRLSGFESRLLAKSPREWERDSPWRSKRHTAFFRGTPYCGPFHRFGRCSRYVIPHLAAHLAAQSRLHENGLTAGSADGSGSSARSGSAAGSGSSARSGVTLDVGLTSYDPSHDTELRRQAELQAQADDRLTNNAGRASGIGTSESDRGSNRDGGSRVGSRGGDSNRLLTPLSRTAPLPQSAYRHHRYLLHLDGHSFSSRLQGLLLTNSLVLKQQSEYVEYFYRALRPWEVYAYASLLPPTRPSHTAIPRFSIVVRPPCLTHSLPTASTPLTAAFHTAAHHTACRFRHGAFWPSRQ